MTTTAKFHERLPWYGWLLAPLVLPAVLVVAIPLGIVALLSIPYYLFSQTITGTCGTLRAHHISVRGSQNGGRDIHASVSLAEFVAQLRAEPVARYRAGGHQMRPRK